MGLRVLRVIYDLQVGGVQRMMLRSFGILREMGVDCEVCCLRGRGELAADFEAVGFPVHQVVFRSRFDPAGLWKLRRLILAGGYDVVHSQMYAANCAVNTALTGLGRPAAVNGYHSTTPAHNARQAARIRRMQAKPAAIVAVSDSVRCALTAIGVCAERVTVVYNGIDLPQKPRPWAPRTAGAPVELLWAGRFVGKKNLGFLVRVAQACRDQAVGARFTLLGSGPDFARVRAGVESAGLGDRVLLPGMVDDVEARMGGCDFFVSTSLREGFSNAMLEAAAAGRGMVLSDIGPYREFDAGRGLAVFPGSTPESWAAAIGEMAEAPARREEMGRRAFERVRDFGLRKVTSELLDLYARAVEAACPARTGFGEVGANS